MQETAPLFILKTANQAVASARKKPVPKRLFREFWSTGELAILFSDTGLGKSALAVQIAQSIASGGPTPTPKSIFVADTGPQKVLLLDLELTEKQFEMRYCRDLGPDDDETGGHFAFSDNFYRAEIDLAAAMPKGQSFHEFLISEIEALLETTQASVLIVDNITFLRQSNETAREAIELMRSLKMLKEKHGLSVLALAHTKKRAAARPIFLSDLHGSRILADLADSIFAIGSSTISHETRYLKHLKHRGGEIECDSSNVAGFILAKLEGNFLGFRFVDFGHEMMHLKDSGDARSLRWSLGCEVRALLFHGHSQRAVAEKLGISAASVNRYQHASDNFVKGYFPNIGRPFPDDEEECDEDEYTEEYPYDRTDGPSAKATSQPSQRRPLLISKPMSEWLRKNGDEDDDNDGSPMRPEHKKLE